MNVALKEKKEGTRIKFVNLKHTMVHMGVKIPNHVIKTKNNRCFELKSPS